MCLLQVLHFVDPFIGDWDGMDYTILSLAGYPSSMALGRNLFIFGNHALYQFAHALFGIQPENAYLIFKYAVVAQGSFAVIAGWVLARDFSKSVHTATLAALLLVFSPVFVLYSGQVMTDVPSVLLLSLALIVHYSGVRQERAWLVFAGAALLEFGRQAFADDRVLRALVDRGRLYAGGVSPAPGFDRPDFMSESLLFALPGGLRSGS